jgi:hypothetical protein
MSFMSSVKWLQGRALQPARPRLSTLEATALLTEEGPTAGTFDTAFDTAEQDSQEAPSCSWGAPAFLAGRDVLDSAGHLMLKSLTYEQLEAWCIHIGISFVPSCTHSLSQSLDGSCMQSRG